MNNYREVKVDSNIQYFQIVIHMQLNGRIQIFLGH